MKRLISLIIALMLLPSASLAEADYDSFLRDYEIMERIDHIINNCFDDSMFFSVDGKPVALISQVNGRQATPDEIYSAYAPQSLPFNGKFTSAAFMAYVYYYLFGLNPTLHADQTDMNTSQTADAEAVRIFLKSCLPGDVIHFLIQTNDGHLAQHWVMVRDVDKENGSILVYESNHQKQVNGQAVQTGIRSDRVMRVADLQHHTIHRYRPKRSYQLMQWVEPIVEVRYINAEAGKASAKILLHNPSAYPITWTGYYRADDIEGLDRIENRVIISEGSQDRWELSRQAKRELSFQNIPLQPQGRQYIQFFAASGREEARSSIFSISGDGTITEGTTPPEISGWTDAQLRAFANAQGEYRGTPIEVDGLRFSVFGNVARFDEVIVDESSWLMEADIDQHLDRGVFRIPARVNGLPVVAVKTLAEGFWIGEAFGGMSSSYLAFDWIKIPEGVVALGDEALRESGNTHLSKGLILPSSLRLMPPAAGQFLGGSSIRLSPWNRTLRLENDLLIDQEQGLLISYLGGNFKESLTVPSAVVFVGPYAFSRFSPQKIVFEPGLLVIDENAFFALDYVDEVFLPESVINIAENAFRGCDDFTLTLPGRFRSQEDAICPGYGVHFIYTGMPAVTMSDEEILSFAKAGRIEGARRYIQDHVKYTIWRDHVRIDGGYPYMGDLPSVVEGLPVVAVASYAYDAAALKRIVIPEGVVAIGDSVFDIGMSMERDYAALELHLPSTLRLSGDMARLFLPTTTVAEGNTTFAVEGDYLVNHRTGQKWYIRHYNENTGDWD